MVARRLPPRDHPGFNLGPAYAFGLRKERDAARDYGNPGEFGWWGGAGTAVLADPRTRICGVLLTEQPDEKQHYSEKFRELVYGARARDLP